MNITAALGILAQDLPIGFCLLVLGISEVLALLANLIQSLRHETYHVLTINLTPDLKIETGGWRSQAGRFFCQDGGSSRIYNISDHSKKPSWVVVDHDDTRKIDWVTRRKTSYFFMHSRITVNVVFEGQREQKKESLAGWSIKEGPDSDLPVLNLRESRIDEILTWLKEKSNQEAMAVASGLADYLVANLNPGYPTNKALLAAYVTGRFEGLVWAWLEERRR